MTRKALGRGLSALLGETAAETPQAGAEDVLLELIDPSPYQPRHAFGADGLAELAASIRSSGVIQPVLLRRHAERYQLVAGERRWRAAKLAGLTGIPAVVRDVSDQVALESALIENLLREDLNAIEVAQAYQALQDQFNLSHDGIASRVGVNRTTVTNTLRLLKLPKAIQDLLSEGKLSAGHARCLLAIESDKTQLNLANKIVRDGWSVRQVEAIVSGPAPSEAKRGEPKKPDAIVDPNVKAAALQLERRLGTRVKIVGSHQRGRIEISYFSGEDLNRIYEIIIGHNNLQQ